MLFLAVLVSEAHRPWGTSFVAWKIRGGEQAATETTADGTEEPSLDEKVKNAMKKLGLQAPPSAQDEGTDGVSPTPEKKQESSQEQEDAFTVAERIASDMGVNKDLALAALGATGEVEHGVGRRIDEEAARALIQHELDMIGGISEDSEDVQQLVSEGHDVFLSRRALAFADGSMEDARAILEADQMDAAEEERAAEAAKKAAEDADPAAAVRAQLREEAAAKKPEMKTVSVKSNFDPTAPLPSTPKPKPAAGGMTPPKPARKEDVVFEVTTAQIQEVVLESPVPVLLDCYADWCGPCKALTPILEEMAVKAGGVFRLVKVNTDNEQAISAALEVKALPTVFAIRDGKVLNNFEGMPRGEEMLKNFMMGLLMPGATFTPPVTEEGKAKFDELSTKLIKTAGAAGFSFAARERLQDRMNQRLKELVEAKEGDMLDAEESAQILRSLMSNIIRNPYDMKFRRVNLQNKKIAAKIAAFSPCISILKSVGFAMEEGGTAMVAGKNKKVVNLSAFTVARDSIDKWIDKNRHAVAVAGRKRKDEEARKKLEEEGAFDTDDEDEEEVVEIDENAVTLKVRIEGKKKVHELELHADDPLSKVVKGLDGADGEDYQITCVAKRLIVKSSDEKNLSKSLRSLGLTPVATLVVKLGTTQKTESPTSLKERVAAQKKNLKKGSHTMQSIGIYAKDDNNKGELIDGGGGVLYEQDVTDDEEEGAENGEEASNDDEVEEEEQQD